MNQQICQKWVEEDLFLDDETRAKKAKKQLTGVELIRENMKELNEVIGYMDFSFECAFTIQEKAFMLAYKVSTPSKLPQLSIYSVTPTRSNKTLTN